MFAAVFFGPFSYCKKHTCYNYRKAYQNESPVRSAIAFHPGPHRKQCFSPFAGVVHLTEHLYGGKIRVLN